MLHVLRFGSSAKPDGVLRGMFAARKAVFVDLLKWNVPVLEDTYEVDQFDNEYARYLVLTDRTGAHLGSARLLPTHRPHILDTLYPDLCAGPPPTGPTTFEITRFCLDRRLRAPARRAVRDTLVAALADHALNQGIDRYTAIAERSWSRQIMTFGWDCHSLGSPRTIDGTTLVALTIAIAAETPALLARAGIAARPVAGADLARIAA